MQTINQQAKFYHQEGYVFPISVLNAQDAEEYLNYLEQVETQYGIENFVNTNWGLKPHLLMTCFDDLIRHPAILDVVEAILGPNLLCYESAFFSKPAHDDQFISWHQDPTYWGLASNEFVSAWVALSPSKIESGCVRVLPRTHKDGILTHVDTFEEKNMLTRGQTVTGNLDESEAVDMELELGQMSLHHVSIVHGSNPNRSDYRRLGFSIRYIPPSVKPITDVQDSAMLVRGTDTHGYWDLEKRPKIDFAPEMIAHHQEIRDRRMNILMNVTHSANSQGKV